MISVNTRLTSSSEANDEVGASIDNLVKRELASGHGQLIAVVNHTRTYTVPKSCTTVSRIYSLMEASKTACGIQEWSVSLATLEDVFIAAVNNSNQT